MFNLQQQFVGHRERQNMYNIILHKESMIFMLASLVQINDFLACGVSPPPLLTPCVPVTCG